ncbi:ChaN family lipoprotein [Thalassospira sp. MA62]|nr:ChaN family lipoprotein [Thalassospira sp. MA62]
MIDHPESILSGKFHASVSFFAKSVATCSIGCLLIAGSAHAQQNDAQQSSTVSPINALPPAPGLIYDLRAKEYIMFKDLVGRVSGAKYVLIGEKHDNPIHHHHQAELVKALSNSDGTDRAIVWEMITRDQQDLLDQNWETTAIDDLGQVLTWQERGWPSWPDYAPIAEIARDENLKMIAGNLPDDLLKPIISDGLSALPDVLADQLDLPAIPTDIQIQLDAEMAAGHCDKLPMSLLPAFSNVQFARDASLARAMYDATQDTDIDGAFLIAGAMHVRNGIAVPWHLKRFDKNITDSDIAVVSMIEADDPDDTPAGITDYAMRMGGEDVVDFMWFTNDIERDDPCDDIPTDQ